MPSFRSLLLLCPAWFAVVACSSGGSGSEPSATGGIESTSSGGDSLAGGSGSGGFQTGGSKNGSGGSDTSSGAKSGSGGSDTSTSAKTGSGGANTAGTNAGGAGGVRADTGGAGAASGRTGMGGAGPAQGGSGAVSAGAGGQATTLQCSDGSGQLVPEMKNCASDDDCQAVPTYNCCGPGPIMGLAKDAQAYLACFQTTPPTDCGLRGCASYASTEDNQTLTNFSDSVSVIARCFEVAAGRKACMTTVQDSCIDNVTRCSTGEICKNECDQPCTCQQGYMACARPTNGAACSMAPKSCPYQLAPGAFPSSVCQCTVAAPVWSCPS